MNACDGTELFSAFCIANGCQCFFHFGQRGGIIDRSRHFKFFVVGNFLNGAPQNFTGARLGKTFDHCCSFEGCYRSYPISNHLYHFLDNVLVITGYTGF